MDKKRLIILGASGSIGGQTLDIISRNEDKYELVGVSVGRDLEKAKNIISKFRPQVVCVRNKEHIEILNSEFPDIEYVYGDEGLVYLSTYGDDDTIIENSLVGSVGVLPTYKALEKNRNVLLANKETLVCAGDCIMDLAKKKNKTVFPIDSEHSAIFQCLVGENIDRVKRLLITCSGGAFRDKDINEFDNLTKEDALKHPNWSMGEKITIDCATMMNKGFEVIEAHHLYNMPYSKIDVLIHKESIVHSLVEYIDSTIKAQLGVSDMRLPISYALSYPDRFYYDNPLSLIDKKLTFENVDEKKYPCFVLAIECAKKGGKYPIILNAANEIAVQLFLNNRIKFTDIYRIVCKEVEENDFNIEMTIDDILKLDKYVKDKLKKEYNI